jgi:hypothetical protein
MKYTYNILVRKPSCFEKASLAILDATIIKGSVKSDYSCRQPRNFFVVGIGGSANVGTVDGEISVGFVWILSSFFLNKCMSILYTLTQKIGKHTVH